MIGKVRLGRENEHPYGWEYVAQITVNTPNGAITLQCEGQEQKSQTSVQQFFLACLRIQSELAELVWKPQDFSSEKP